MTGWPLPRSPFCPVCFFCGGAVCPSVHTAKPDYKAQGHCFPEGLVFSAGGSSFHCRFRLFPHQLPAPY